MSVMTHRPEHATKTRQEEGRGGVDVVIGNQWTLKGMKYQWTLKHWSLMFDHYFLLWLLETGCVLESSRLLKDCVKWDYCYLPKMYL